ncbi:uncharacterized protein [Miscanthus floridulus]|uniref:uncharacterized protein n=1 Tax=Miscanthus floridulus TaxID=154761 RepID=UPI0034588E70
MHRRSPSSVVAGLPRPPRARLHLPSSAASSSILHFAPSPPRGSSRQRQQATAATAPFPQPPSSTLARQHNSCPHRCSSALAFVTSKEKDSDLARRFDVLKSCAAAMDELEARFAALKGAAVGPEKDARVRLEDLGGESSEDEADEVDKVMRWAMDAACLDVAAAGADGKAKKRADDDKEEEEKGEKSSVSSEDDDDEDERLRLEMARKKMAKIKSKNKWFFL